MKTKHLFTALASLLVLLMLSAFSVNESSGLVDDVFSKTNQFRKSKRLPALTLRNELNKIAQQHSTNMAKGSVGFGHGGFEKRNAQAKRSIQHLSIFAENVAHGATTAQEVVNMWKNSPGHRRNMLGPYKYIGIGIAKDKKGRIYYTQVFGG